MINKMVKKGRSIIELIVTGIVISHLMLTSTAHAITVQYELIPLGGNQYRYVYTVTNDGSLGAGVAVKLFDLVFDSASYQETSLAIVTSAPLNSQWDEFILSSILDVPAAYSAFSSTIGIAQGETVSGFAVEFEWIGSAAIPGAQAFQVFDPNTFELLEEGITTHNDNGQLGTPQFTDFHPKVAENVGAVTLTVSRVGGSDGELTVNYATTSDTATDGSDYSGATGTLTWADGDNSDKTFMVTIRDDRNPEDPETFTVTLGMPNSGESLDSATITIVDNTITLVTLVDFSATALETEILLEWQSAIELDNAGFHIWRATGEGWKNGDYSTVIRLTDRLIPAQGNSIPYSYIDSNVETGLTYYYGLEDIDLSGHSTFHWDYIDSATAK
jgi:hypothetical protein